MFENRPTQIAGVLYILFIILFTIGIILNRDIWLQLFIILLISIPYTILSLYDIDCVFIGNCETWGWIKGVLFILYLILLIVAAVIIIMFESINTKNNADSKDLLPPIPIIDEPVMPEDDEARFYIAYKNNQVVGQSTGQSMSKTAGQSAGQTMGQSMGQLAGQSTGQLTGQSTAAPTTAVPTAQNKDQQENNQDNKKNSNPIPSPYYSPTLSTYYAPISNNGKLMDEIITKNNTKDKDNKDKDKKDKKDNDKKKNDDDKKKKKKKNDDDDKKKKKNKD